MSSKPKILFYPHIKYKAQFFLRYLWPASRLSQNGYEVRVKDPRLTGEWTEEQMAEQFDWADIVVAFYPKTRSGATLVEICEAMNAKLVVDSDDFSFAVHPSNVAYAFSGTEDVEGLWTSGVQWRKDVAMQNHMRWMYVMQKCHAMSVTQHVLADLYAPYVGPYKLWVLPNSLDLNFYKPWKRRHPEDEVRIGWQGGASHFADLAMIKEPLQEICRKHDNVKLVFMGQEWDAVKEAHLDAEFHPWVDSDTFCLKLGALDLDIGICPIEDNVFGRGKSNLKMLEYGAFNVPSVCSQIQDGPYNPPEPECDGMDRVMVRENDPQLWFEKIDMLVKDRGMRQEIGKNARETLEKVYNIDVTWKLWADFYDEIHEGVVDLSL